MVDLGPTHTDDPRAVAARAKRAAPRNYIYRQPQRTAAEMLLRRKERRPFYVARVADDRAGRPVARTERYDPERGSGNPTRVDIPRLPGSIAVPMVVFGIAVCVILFVALPFPLSTVAMLYWSFSLFWRMAYAVERKRFAAHLCHLPDPPPPLMSAEELDAEVFRLANPDEDRTFDEPAPIPMAQGLRDPAWKRWADRLENLDGQEYRVGQMTYRIKKNNGFADRTDHALYKFVDDIRSEAAFYGDYSRIEYVTNDEGVRQQRKITVSKEDNESLRPLFEALGREVLGDERVADLEDSRRAHAHGEALLERRFTARTDCADGHVGEHPILSTFTDSLGRKRVRRSCLWCPSVWADRV